MPSYSGGPLYIFTGAGAWGGRQECANVIPGTRRMCADITLAIYYVTIHSTYSIHGYLEYMEYSIMHDILIWDMWNELRVSYQMISSGISSGIIFVNAMYLH